MEHTTTNVFKVVRKRADGSLVSAHPELVRPWQVEYIPYQPTLPLMEHSLLFAFLTDQEESARRFLSQMREFYSRESFHLWHAHALVVPGELIEVAAVNEISALENHWRMRYARRPEEKLVESIHLPHSWEVTGVYCASITLDLPVVDDTESQALEG